MIRLSSSVMACGASLPSRRCTVTDWLAVSPPTSRTSTVMVWWAWSSKSSRAGSATETAPVVSSMAKRPPASSVSAKVRLSPASGSDATAVPSTVPAAASSNTACSAPSGAPASHLSAV